MKKQRNYWDKVFLTYEDRRWCVTTPSSCPKGQTAIKCEIMNYKDEILFEFFIEYSFLNDYLYKEDFKYHKDRVLTEAVHYLYHTLELDGTRKWEVKYELVQEIMGLWRKYNKNYLEGEQKGAWNSFKRMNQKMIVLLTEKRMRNVIVMSKDHKFFETEDED